MLGSTFGFVAFCGMIAVCFGLLATAVVQALGVWQARPTGEGASRFADACFHRKSKSR